MEASTQRIRAATVALGVALLATGDLATAADSDPAATQERIARENVHTLRAAVRNLKKISKQAASASDGETYTSWLRSAGKRIDSIAGRWKSKLEWFHRDFPRVALDADPERLAYAAEWLGDVNDILSREARALADELLEKNQQFTVESLATEVASARTVLASIGAAP